MYLYQQVLGCLSFTTQYHARGTKADLPALSWFQVEEVLAQVKEVLLRYCWNHCTKPCTSSWGYIAKKHACPFPLISYPFHGKWPVIHSRISVLAKNRNYFPDERGHCGETSITQTSTNTENSCRVWLPWPASTDRSQLWDLCLAMDAGSFWWGQEEDGEDV